MANTPQSVLVLIPARYASSRFPGKPLASIGPDTTMIQTVYRNCQDIFADSSLVEGRTVVVTDDDRIESHVQDFGGEVVRVNDLVASGTERIALALERFYSDQKWDFVINVQGDEPLLKAAELRRLIDFHAQSEFDIATLVKERRGDGPSYFDPNRVKVAYSAGSGRCHYFSRSPIPYVRDQEVPNLWFFHVGVYSYRPESLCRFVAAEVSPLEDDEKLEQLRALENDMTIGATKITTDLIGVDVPEDLERVKGVIDGSQ